MNVLVIGTTKPIAQVSALLHYACHRYFDVIVCNASKWSDISPEDRHLILKYYQYYKAELSFAGITIDTDIITGDHVMGRIKLDPTVYMDTISDNEEKKPSDYAIFKFIEKHYDNPLFVVRRAADAKKLRAAGKMASKTAQPYFLAEPPADANMPIIAIGYAYDPLPTRFINADELGLPVDVFLD
jgi:hypothetical protein